MKAQKNQKKWSKFNVPEVGGRWKLGFDKVVSINLFFSASNKKYPLSKRKENFVYILQISEGIFLLWFIIRMIGIIPSSFAGRELCFKLMVSVRIPFFSQRKVNKIAYFVSFHQQYLQQITDVKSNPRMSLCVKYWIQEIIKDTGGLFSPRWVQADSVFLMFSFQLKTF